MNRFKLRAIVSAGVAALAMGSLAACGSSSDSSDAEKGSGEKAIKVAVFPSFVSLGAYQTMADDVFEKEGLKVDFVIANTPADIAPMLSSGEIQFGLMDLTTPVLAASKATKAPFVFVAPASKGTPLDAEGWGTGNVWVQAGSKIKSIKDLENAKFGIPQLNSQLWLDIRTDVDKAGGDSSKIQWVQIPDAAQSLTSLRAGQIDATTSSEPSGTTWTSEKAVERLDGFVSNEGHVAFSFVATSDYAKSNADVLSKFESAILAGNKTFNTLDKAGKAALARTVNEKWAPEVLANARYSQMGEVGVSEADVQYSIDRMKKYDVVEKDSKLVGSDLLP